MPVFTRCVEIGRFMSELIDSLCYYELYDFYKKSVLITLHSSVSFLPVFDMLLFDVVIGVLLITVTGELLIAATPLQRSMICAFKRT